MADERILIAGIGNIFLGDDAFGVEVVQRMATRPLPNGVKVVDFGIRGFDLAYALMDDWDATIMVDTMARGEPPGTLFVIEPDLEQLGPPGAQAIEGHSMHPIKVLQMVKSFGGTSSRVLLVGCEPATFGPDEGQMGLSEPVQGAIEQAVQLIESLIEQIRRNEGVNT